MVAVGEAAPGGSRFGVLRERDFRLFYFANTVSQLGNVITPIALSFAVLGLTGSVAALTYVLAAGTAPLLVFLLIGGVVADRLPRQRLMVAADLVQCASQAAAATLLIAGHAHVWQLVLLQAANGTAYAFFTPASSGLVALLVRGDSLVQANALLEISSAAALLVGPLLAAVFLATAGAGSALGLDAATFGASALLVSRIGLRRLGRADAGTSFVRDLLAGWEEFRARTWMWATVSQHAAFNMLVVAPVFTLGVVVAKERLGGATAWSTIIAASGLGSLLGGALALRSRQRRPLVAAAIGTALVTPQVVLLAVAAPTTAIAAGAVLAGAGIAFELTVWEATQQARVPAEVYSRTRSYGFLVSLASLPVGYMLVGPLSAALGVAHTLWLAAAVALLSSCALLLVPSVRRPD